MHSGPKARHAHTRDVTPNSNHLPPQRPAIYCVGGPLDTLTVRVHPEVVTTGHLLVPQHCGRYVALGSSTSDWNWERDHDE